jgi:hypothetical protein
MRNQTAPAYCKAKAGPLALRRQKRSSAKGIFVTGFANRKAHAPRVALCQH